MTLTEAYEGLRKEQEGEYCIKHEKCPIEILVEGMKRCNYAFHCDERKFREAMSTFEGDETK